VDFGLIVCIFSKRLPFIGAQREIMKFFSIDKCFEGINKNNN